MHHWVLIIFTLINGSTAGYYVSSVELSSADACYEAQKVVAVLMLKDWVKVKTVCVAKGD